MVLYINKFLLLPTQNMKKGTVMVNIKFIRCKGVNPLYCLEVI